MPPPLTGTTARPARPRLSAPVATMPIRFFAHWDHCDSPSRAPERGSATRSPPRTANRRGRVRSTSGDNSRGPRALHPLGGGRVKPRPLPFRPADFGCRRASSRHTRRQDAGQPPRRGGEQPLAVEYLLGRKTMNNTSLKSHRFKSHAVPLLFYLCANAVLAQGSLYLVANFDDLSEGGMGAAFSDGGITFSNPDPRFTPYEQGAFAIQATHSGSPHVSLPNYLTFGGYVPGVINGYSFGRCGSFDIDFPSLASTASMDVFAEPNTSTNTLILQALLQGNIVAADSTALSGSGSSAVVFDQLSVSGQFDSLRLVVDGPGQTGVLLFGVDNVTISLVPEPSSDALLCIGFVLFAFCHRMTRRGGVVA